MVQYADIVTQPISVVPIPYCSRSPSLRARSGQVRSGQPDQVRSLIGYLSSHVSESVRSGRVRSGRSPCTCRPMSQNQSGQVVSGQVRSLTVYLSSHVSESVMSTSTSEAGSAGRRQLSILGGGSASHPEKLGESLGTR